MGYDIRVHQEYFRLHESTLELAKVVKIVTVMEEGKISQTFAKYINDTKAELGDAIKWRSLKPSASDH